MRLYFDTLLRYMSSVTFSGAAVLKVMGQMTLVKVRIILWKYKHLESLPDTSLSSTNLWLETICQTLFLCPFWGIGEGTFFIWRGGGGGCRPGLRRRGSLVNFLQIGEGQTCFILKWGRVTVFLARKKLLHVASILYTSKATSKD